MRIQYPIFIYYNGGCISKSIMCTIQYTVHIHIVHRILIQAPEICLLIDLNETKENAILIKQKHFRKRQISNTLEVSTYTPMEHFQNNRMSYTLNLLWKECLYTFIFYTFLSEIFLKEIVLYKCIPIYRWIGGWMDR